MFLNKYIKQFNASKTYFRCINVMLIVIFISVSCSEDTNKVSTRLTPKLNYLNCIDSTTFELEIKPDNDYHFMRYGYNIKKLADSSLQFESIDSDKRFNTFNLHTNDYKQSKIITSSEIDAYMIDDENIILLCNDSVFKLDKSLNRINSFSFIKPKLNLKHGIDFSSGKRANIFKTHNMYAIVYYEITEERIYKTTNKIFYYFNADTAYFENKVCSELDTSYQYFRFPSTVSKDDFIFYTPTTLNCIMKVNSSKNILHTSIETNPEVYLSLKHEDIYQISKLKKYRFSTDYNLALFTDQKSLYLLKEFKDYDTIIDGIKEYDRDLKIIKYDFDLNKLNEFYIEDNRFSTFTINDNKLTILNFQKNKLYRYELL